MRSAIAEEIISGRKIHLDQFDEVVARPLRNARIDGARLHIEIESTEVCVDFDSKAQAIILH